MVRVGSSVIRGLTVGSSAIALVTPAANNIRVENVSRTTLVTPNSSALGSRYALNHASDPGSPWG